MVLRGVSPGESKLELLLRLLRDRGAVTEGDGDGPKFRKKVLRNGRRSAGSADDSNLPRCAGWSALVGIRWR